MIGNIRDTDRGIVSEQSTIAVGGTQRRRSTWAWVSNRASRGRRM